MGEGGQSGRFACGIGCAPARVLHVLAADGAFLPDSRFVALPPVPASRLAEGFRRGVLDFLVKNEVLSAELRARMLAWRHGGFSVHNEVSVAAEDTEGRKKLAGYVLG